MTKKRKLMLTFGASMLCALVGTTAVATLNASANGEESTELTASSFVLPGAQVRLDAPQGIRFPVRLTKAVWEANKSNIVESGTLLCPSEYYVEGKELELLDDYSAVRTIEKETTTNWYAYTDVDGTEYYQTIVYVYGIEAEDLSTPLMARAYVVLEDGTEILSDATTTRSMSQVAYDVLYNPAYASQKDALQGYIGSDYVETLAKLEDFEVYNSVSDITISTTDNETVTSYTLTANDVTVDLSAKNVTEEPKVMMIVDGEKTDVSADYVSIESGVVTVQGEAFGSSVYGDVKLALVTEDKAYETSVNVVTKYIDDKADIENMLFYGGIDANTTEKAYDGYFVMTGDVNFENTGLKYRNNGNVLASPTHQNYQNNNYHQTAGFSGIFDGQGHKIYNFHFEQYSQGIFGNANTQSTIKNTAFVGSKTYNANWGRAFVLGDNISSKIHNCYFDVVVSANSTATNGENVLLAGSMADADLKDVVIKFDSTNSKATTAYLTNTPSVSYHMCTNPITTSNVHVFTTAKQAWINGWDNTHEWFVGTKNNIMAGITVNGLNDTVAPITVTDSTYWYLNGDQPIFRSVGNAVRNIDYTGDTYQETAFETYASSTVTYTGPHYNPDKDSVSYTLNPNTFLIDLNGYNLPENPKAINLVSDRATKSVDTSCFSNNVLTIADVGSDIYGEVMVEFITEDCTYKVSSFNIVTKYIKTTEDIERMPFYGGLDLTDETYWAYDGYFVQTANVGSTGSAMTFRVHPHLWTTANYAYYNGDAGFKGVYDGQGNTISFAMWGGTYNRTGIFGSTQIGSEIKNVKFVGNIFDVNDSGRGGFLLGRAISSKITNCYFDITSGNGNTTTEFAALAMYTTYAEMKDCVIKTDFTNLTACSNPAWLCYGPGNMGGNGPGNWNSPVSPITFKNVYVFTTHTSASYVFNQGNTQSQILTSGISINDYNATVSGVTMTDSTYWDLTGAQPVWKGPAA